MATRTGFDFTAEASRTLTGECATRVCDDCRTAIESGYRRAWEHGHEAARIEAQEKQRSDSDRAPFFRMVEDARDFNTAVYPKPSDGERVLVDIIQRWYEAGRRSARREEADVDRLAVIASGYRARVRQASGDGEDDDAGLLPFVLAECCMRDLEALKSWKPAPKE